MLAQQKQTNSICGIHLIQLHERGLEPRTMGTNYFFFDLFVVQAIDLIIYFVEFALVNSYCLFDTKFQFPFQSIFEQPNI